MKTISTLLLFTFTALAASFAQDNLSLSKHLTFKNIPIDGTLIEYVSKLQKSGFTHVGTENKVAIMKGDFAGYKDCTLGVATLKDKDLVSKIVVMFPEQDTWSGLSLNYYALKELLTEKYGEPSNSKEEFDSRLQPRDDMEKMHEVGFDNCKYYTTYETDKGSIQLSIDHDGVISSFISLSYSDKVNSKIIRAKAISDL